MRVRGVISARSGAGLYVPLGVCAVTAPGCPQKGSSTLSHGFQLGISSLVPCLVSFLSVRPVALLVMIPARLKDCYLTRDLFCHVFIQELCGKALESRN